MSQEVKYPAFAEETAAGAAGTLPAPTAATGRPFTVWKPSDFFAHVPDPSGVFLGNSLIERGEWTSVVGIGGLGKTRIVLWFCICQITGRPWCGIPTMGEPQIALILSTENGLRRWKTDLEKMFSVLDERERALVEKHLLILALTSEEEGDLCLGDLANVTSIGATLRMVNPGITVFDPFADMVDGDENKTADVVGTMRCLRQIVRANAPKTAPVIVHHARTGAGNVAQAGDNFAAGNFGRGAKALYSRVRCEIQLAPADRDDPARIVLACGKCNNGEKFQTRGVVFNPDNFTYEVDPTFDLDSWRADVAGKRGQKSASVVEVVEAVADICGEQGVTASAGAIRDAVRTDTGASVRTINTRIKEALQGGYLKRPARGAYSLGPKMLRK